MERETAVTPIGNGRNDNGATGRHCSLTAKEASALAQPTTEGDKAAQACDHQHSTRRLGHGAGDRSRRDQSIKDYILIASVTRVAPATVDRLNGKDVGFASMKIRTEARLIDNAGKAIVLISQNFVAIDI